MQFSSPKSKKRMLLGRLQEIDDEPKPYEALRIASGFIVFFGWVLIIVGWLFAITFGYTYAVNIAGQFVSDAEPYSRVQLFGNVAFFVMGLVPTIQGLFMIASGQVFMALLDIRNDAHITKGYVRHLGAMIFDELSSSAPPQDNEKKDPSLNP
jgi:hypothetical protein